MRFKIEGDCFLKAGGTSKFPSVKINLERHLQADNISRVTQTHPGFCPAPGFEDLLHLKKKTPNTLTREKRPLPTHSDGSESLALVKSCTMT